VFETAKRMRGNRSQNYNPKGLNSPEHLVYDYKTHGPKVVALQHPAPCQLSNRPYLYKNICFQFCKFLPPARGPKLVKMLLSNLKCPVMTRLVHHWADFGSVLILAIIENFADTKLHVLLQQRSAPSSGLPDALFPPTDLPLVIIAPSPLVEARVPLEPAANIIFMADPSTGFPFFDALATGHFVFVYIGIIIRIRQECRDIQA